LLCSREGDLVADLFCGSGTTPAAAFDLGRRFFALDRGDAALAVVGGGLLHGVRRLPLLCA
jgi:adenine specific DNA methylase Mod